MHTVFANTIGEAWLKAAALILHGPHELVRDDKGIILELLSVTIQISTPESNDTLLEQYANKDTVQFMQKNFRELVPVLNWGYSYAQRLYDYHGNNQIAKVVKTLQSNPFSKSTTISLLDEKADQFHKPCLTSLDFKVRKGALSVTAFFRSQDIGKKMYADALELLHLGNSIASQISIDNVELIFFISSAHIYQTDKISLLKIIETMESSL